MAYARARELCQQVGEPPQLFAVLSGLHEFYLQRIFPPHFGERRTISGGYLNSCPIM